MADKQSVSIDTVPLPDRSVRVVVPARVAFNLKDFQKSLESIAERLGCPACLSGADCRFEFERDFVIDAKTLGIRGR